MTRAERSWRSLVEATALATMAWGTPVFGYEQATHAALTREAYMRSALNPGISELAMRLGLEPSRDAAVGDWYVDMAPTSDSQRKASPDDLPTFANNKIRDANFWSPDFKPTLPTLPAWLMLGSIREDDVPRDANALENNPQDEPGGPFIRVLRHFYDPYLDRGMVTWATAPDWALEPSAETHKNHFTVVDAREAMWRALTLKQIDASGALVDLVAPSGVVDVGRYLRDLRVQYWATTFRALGDVLHLLQDMAQPQHTRGDPHSGTGCAAPTCLAGHASYFEKYVDARITGGSSFTLRERFFGGILSTDSVENVAPRGFQYGDYSTVSATKYRDYFVTASGLESLEGAGLANYSNQGFFTAGTNIDAAGAQYPSPPPTPGAFQSESIPATAVTNANGESIPHGGTLVLLRGEVHDHWAPGQSSAGVALSSFGAFDQFMRPKGWRQFTLNHYNYDDQARLLLPRAIAYSAGLLDYFFRGMLDISLPSAGAYAVVDHTQPGCTATCGFKTVKLKLKNSTPSEALSNGFFVAVAKFFRNNKYSPDLSGEPGGPNFTGFDARSLWEEIVVSDKVAISTLPGGRLGSNGEAEIQFNFASPIPINATDIYLQVVFRGQLGNETDAVAVTTKNISEPNYIAVVNDLDYRYNASNDSFQSTNPATDTQTVTNIDIKLGSATTPIASLPRLDVRQYAQLAVLTDLGSTETESLVIDFNDTGANTPLTFTNFPIATFVSTGVGNYGRTRLVSKYRGMWSDYRFDLFNGYVYGLAPCLEGDTRRICTSAGLTTIPASNAVAWSINFP
jgi:hypothetical protein